MAKTITDILPPSRRQRLESEPRDMDAAIPPHRPTPPSRRQRPSGGRKFPYGTALIALLVVAGSAAALYAFGGAKVEIAPAANAVYVASDFSATPASGDLPFETISVEKVATQSVPAESTETVNDPARGTIVISNAQPTAQTLIKNTRFESSGGLIFRIRDSVTIPAATASGPGTLSATVYADAGGDQYNIGPTTFTVPGLKGSKAFDQVTAKSNDPMTGGFSGTRPSVSEATRNAQNSANQASLEKSLGDGLSDKVPEGYVLVPGSTFVTYEPQPDAAGNGNSVNVSMKGTVTGVVFPKEALAKAVAYKTIGTYSGQPVTLPDVSGLALKPSVNVPPVNGETTFAFSLTGNTSIVWKIDEAKIAGAVAGKTRDSAQNALSGFPEVDRAVLVLRPFWSGSFPQDPSKIKVTTEASAGE